jgi:hypothetical protein
MSAFQSLGLEVLVSDPLIAGKAWLFNLAREVAGYSHTISAYGGFDGASLTLNASSETAEDWLERGLGRHVEIVDGDLRPVWRGFVDQVEVSQGLLTVSRGPLMDVANRVSTTYSKIDPSTNPPLSLGQASTVITQDLLSQGLYGIWEKVLSAGQATDADAAYAQAAFLAERAQPARSQSINTQSASASTVTLNLRGYFYWLQAYIYSQVASSGVTDARALVLAALAASPNAVFSADTSRLDANALLVPAYAPAGDAFAESVIKSVLALGDASGNRWTFGVYEDGVAIYAAAPTAIEYVQSVKAQDTSVHGLAGELIRPWAVRPARWLFLDDYLIGRGLPAAALSADPRAIFIEQVQYALPYGLSLSGGRLERLAQIMAQITSGGMF